MVTHPRETEIAQVMRETGMARMQAINHIRGRMVLHAMQARGRVRAGVGL